MRETKSRQSANDPIADIPPSNYEVLMKSHLLALISLMLSACSVDRTQLGVSVEIVEVSPKGVLRFVVTNSGDKKICSSIYGVGTIRGIPSLIFSGDVEQVHQNIYELRDFVPERERIEFAPRSRKSFEVDLRENYWINTDDISVGVKVPIWDCKADVPLELTLEHEQVYGPGYLKDRGVEWVASGFVSPDISAWAPET